MLRVIPALNQVAASAASDAPDDDSGRQPDAALAASGSPVADASGSLVHPATESGGGREGAAVGQVAEFTGGTPAPLPAADAHKRRMRTLQASMRAAMDAARAARDLVIVHTGDGKGKSTAAFGMLARNIGHRRRAVVVQFVKEGDHAIRAALAGDFLEWHAAGNGFTWDTQNREADTAAARAGWQLALAALRDPATRFVLLDELNIILQCGYLPVVEVLDGLRSRAPGKHVVITGRGAPAELIAFADLVTEMREVKHPFRDGVRAQPGVEF